MNDAEFLVWVDQWKGQCNRELHSGVNIDVANVYFEKLYIENQMRQFLGGYAQ